MMTVTAAYTSSKYGLGALRISDTGLWIFD